MSDVRDVGAVDDELIHVRQNPEVTRPRVVEVALVDVRSFQMIAVIILFAAFGGMFLAFTTHLAVGLGCVAVAAAVAGVLTWRLRRFAAILRDGEPVTGRLDVIRRPVVASGRGRHRYNFIYSYSYDGKDYRRSHRVSVLSPQVPLEVGQPVTVLVNATSPRENLVIELFQQVRW